MKVGCLHLGPHTDGLSRYGRLLSAAMARQPGIEMIDAVVSQDIGQPDLAVTLAKAAEQLTKADVIYFQFNPRIWGLKRGKRSSLDDFLRRIRNPLAVTLHDVTGAPIFSQGIKRWWHRYQYPGSVGLGRVLEQVELAIVFDEQEAHTVGQNRFQHKIAVVPHFVEYRDLTVSPEEARRRLGLVAKQVVTLLGFIHPRKGYHLVVEALPRLATDIQVVFVGCPSRGHEEYAAKLVRRAAELGAAERMTITGFVEESQLNDYLSATHLAICPFQSMSASGSLSTWISAAKPILAHNLPQFRQYNRLSSNALALFDDATPEGIAAAIDTQLSRPNPEQLVAIGALRQRLDISVIAEEHCKHFERLVTLPSIGNDRSRDSACATKMPGGG